MTEKIVGTDAGHVDVSSGEKPQLQDDSNDSMSTGGSGGKGALARVKENHTARSVWKIFAWMPRRCRWSAENPPQFSLGLNILFGFVSTCHRAAQQFWASSSLSPIQSTLC